MTRGLARSITPPVVVLVRRPAAVTNAAPPPGEPVFPIVPPRCYRCLKAGTSGLLDECDGHRGAP